MDLLFKLRALVEKFSDVFLSVQFYIFLTFFYCSASNHQIKKINKAVVLFSAWLWYGNLDIFLLIDHNFTAHLLAGWKCKWWFPYDGSTSCRGSVVHQGSSKAACGSSACKAGDRERAVGFIFLKARAVALHSVFRRHTATHPPANSSWLPVEVRLQAGNINS